MKFTDRAGKITADSANAKFFVSKWFKPDDKICITGTRSEKVGKYDVVSQSITAQEFLDTVTDDVLKPLILDYDGAMYNLYVNVCPILEDVELTQRGKESNVDYVPGVWVDLDVKDGRFESQGEILEWLKTIALEPTLICGSGSGGVHAYWRLNWEEEGTKELVLMWWTYLSAMAGDKHIDKLYDTTRMLRMPGTTRFPKKEEPDAKPSPVKLLGWSENTYSVDQIKDISAEAFEKYDAKKRVTIEEDSKRRIDMDYFARSLLGYSSSNKWGLYWAIAHIEDIVNTNYDWEDILTPHGWTYLRDLRDGSKEFARPGRQERSAVVDFEGSPVMSLLSSAEETGLMDLKEAGIHLSKYRVLLRLTYNDDEEMLIRDILRKKE